MKSKKRILIIEDEYATLISLQKILQSDEIQVDIADNFNKALDIINEHNYDVIITDIRLEGNHDESGISIIEYVKNKGFNTSFIVITGNGSENIKRKIFLLGVEYYYEKPIEIASLKKAVYKLVSRC